MDRYIDIVGPTSQEIYNLNLKGLVILVPTKFSKKT